MAERRNPSQRTEETRGSADRQTGQRRSTQERQQPPVRRSDVIRCERCGEDYSITYKRCPFCDERPGRTGIGGRRVSNRRGQVHPIQLVGLIISMIVIIAALFIVFKYVGPLIFGEKDPGGSSSSAGTSQGTDSSTPGSSSSSGQTDGSNPSGGDVSEEPPVINVTYLALDKSDITLRADEEFQFTPSVSPANATITWTSSDPSILKVEQDGTILNVNATGSKVKVTVTATAGDKTAECIVYCNGTGAGGTTSQEPEETTPSEPTTTPSGGGEVSSVPVPPRSLGTVVNAGGSGLNIRSGPGSNYDRVASAENGARVTIMEDMRNGWYKIDYGNGQLGYVSSAFIEVD